MEEEIEDIFGDVAYTDSQKSVTMEVCSCEFTDTSSDKNNSSGRETYLIDVDDSYDSEYFESHNNLSSVMPNDKYNKNQCLQLQVNKNNLLKKCGTVKTIAETERISIVAQETFTQTSKTIIEIAETEGLHSAKPLNSLETQTSFVCITENKTYEYRIEYTGNKNYMTHSQCDNADYHNFTNSLDDGSSKFPISETENERFENSSNSNEEVIRIIDGDSKEIISSEDKYVEKSEFQDSSRSDSDYEKDSLMEYRPNKIDNVINDSNSDSSEFPKSLDNDVEELYSKLSESIELMTPERSDEITIRRFGTLTPLSEESMTKKGSIVDITPTITADSLDDDKDILFTNDQGIRVKVLPEEKTILEQVEPFKLPPIHNHLSCPNSPHLSLLFTVNSFNQPLSKSETLPCLFKGDKSNVNRWDSRNLASGENPLLNEKKKKPEIIQLPPIHIDSQIQQTYKQPYSNRSNVSKTETTNSEPVCASICIKEKIKELKISEKRKLLSRKSRVHSPSVGSRTGSPDTARSVGVGDGRRSDAAERGCDALCVDLLQRLRSSTWFEIADTLDNLPNSLSKFWGLIGEQRIADLIRQVSVHVDSPRTQVACTACNALAAILKNTGYVKKPDFYEAVTSLLVKTGSFSRPVRRAANVALDAVVSSVDLSHAVTALCVHGVEHKSGLVRAAAARLLVVCAALGGAGRGLLRGHAPRRAALRALALLLDDRNPDARKYAERLYSMLRPLPNFEAYYLTEVTVELASAQMKKYDQLLMSGTSAKDSR